jgi:two-component system cell cycle sensor histidine kinase/response regulator CckA
MNSEIVNTAPISPSATAAFLPTEGRAITRILLVDDNQAIHHDYKKILQPEARISQLDDLEAAIFGKREDQFEQPEFELDSAFQGQEALGLVQSACAVGRPYALAFVDVRMPPGWDGIETVQKLWQVDPSLQIVICTAYSDYSWNEIVTKLGRTDRFVILKKPFDIIEIQQLAYSQTEKWRLATSLQRHLNTLEDTIHQRTNDLENSVSLLKATLDSTADGIYVIGKDGVILGSNRKFAELWGLAPDERDRETILKKVSSQVPDPDAFLQKITEIYARPDCIEFETISLKDGRIFERYSQPQKIGDQVVGRVWSYRDVTKREQLSEQLRQTQKMDSIGRLAGGVAHDFNNILTVIQGHSALLLSTECAPDITESHQQIFNAAEKAANLTRQLLTFSRKQVMRLANIDLNNVVRDLSKMLKRVLGEDIAFKVQLTADPAFVHADTAMMEQIMLNLAINARDAMTGGGTLRFETKIVNVNEGALHEGTAKGEFACLSISDTGCGISEADLPHIFEPFFTTKATGKGTGLGLATVYGIVKQHKGWIKVSSVVGKGTTFEVFLPRIRRASINSGPSIPEEMIGGDETILLVEDELPVRTLVSTLLTRLGYRILQAESGVVAQQVWREHREEIDLLLTDMIMPEGVNGRELADILLAQKPKLRVIFSSGYSRDLFGKDMLIDGGFNFLPKPYHPRQLARAVRSALDQEPSSVAKI